MKPEDRESANEAIEFSDGSESQSKLHSDDELKKWAENFKVGENDGTHRPR